MAIADAIGSVLTQGIDAVKQIKLAQFQVSNPNPNTSSPGGAPVQAGAGAFSGASVAGIPLMPILLVLGAVVAFKLLRK